MILRVYDKRGFDKSVVVEHLVELRSRVRKRSRFRFERRRYERLTQERVSLTPVVHGLVCSTTWVPVAR
jgi:hypothetical protein